MVQINNRIWFMLSVISLVALFISCVTTQVETRSVITNLADKTCRLIAEGEDGETWTKRECTGAGDCSVIKYNDDDRESLTIKCAEASTDIDFAKITPGFTHLADKAEWLVTDSSKARPYALIVQLNISPYDKEPKREVLVILKIEKGASCIIKTLDIADTKGAAELARSIGDQAAKQSCLF